MKFSKMLNNFLNFLQIENSGIFCKILQICLREDDIFGDFEKCCKMRIRTQKSASIQSRTSFLKWSYSDLTPASVYWDPTGAEWISSRSVEGTRRLVNATSISWRIKEEKRRRAPLKCARRATAAGNGGRLSARRSTMEEGHTGHDTITLSKARSRLHQRRFSRPNTHFAAFFKL